ncbi:Receptor-type tyrosine-protein phosphatase R [Plecturocebus cupreus]
MPIIAATLEAKAGESLDGGCAVPSVHGSHVYVHGYSVFSSHLQTLQMDVNKLNITLLRIFRQGVAAALGLLPQQVHINRLINFGMPRWMDHLRSGVRDLPCQQGETPSLLLKIQKKIAGNGCGCLESHLLGRPRQENCLNLRDGGFSQQRSCHCTPPWSTRAKLCLKKKSWI